MNKNKLIKLQKKGWKSGSAKDFLDLSKSESAYIEFKLILSQILKSLRKQQGLSQVEAAKMLKSSQSRVAKMENGDPSVSADLLIKSLFKLGSTQQEIAKLIHSHMV